MSSSFAANRARPEEKQTHDQPQQQSQRSNYNQREERKSNPPNKQGSRGGERTRNNIQNYEKSNSQGISNNDGSTTPSSGNNTNTNINSMQNTTRGTSSNRRNERNERPTRKERDQPPRQSMGTGGGVNSNSYQGNKRGQDYKANDNKSYQQRENNVRITNENKNVNNYQQNQHKSSNMDSAMDKLTESASKMSIQNKKESQNRGRHQTGSGRPSNNSLNAQNSSTQQKSNSNQMQTGQFVGSQNFSNKTQAPSPQVVPQPNQQQSHTATTYVSQLPNGGYSYDPSKIMGFQTKEANEYAMNLLKSQGMLPQQSSAPSQQTQVPPQPPQIIANSQPAPPPQAVAYITPTPNNVFVAPTPQQTQIMVPAGGNWHWNIGDICLAKYWEDGNVS